ncbi:TetR/AcrR family transcriptional regulator [Actinomycetospora termitidis]|uniref:TetR family transcriptional regulator n=1 Tax=Actinomycetospora termitidis TaxID=3053470 RepID=A0ABT7MG79_9PSEU|nr:TetR family transcriptional regulator [Actinomycetospora sp. Odt1-22]MDL5159678.1 TetR family transcriptional regulator [Actinomycetospora sp. Odt1-22]
MSEPRARRHDPERRDRIVEACLDVLAEVGVAGTSHRRVAAAADVPLGSMTYHFTGMSELLHEAFDRLARTVSARFDEQLAAAGDQDSARKALVAFIDHDILSDPRELVLSHELYTLAARAPAYRDITHAWMAASRRSLRRHFDPLTARLLDALVEGLSIHRALDLEAPTPGATDEAIRRMLRA